MVSRAGSRAGDPHEPAPAEPKEPALGAGFPLGNPARASVEGTPGGGRFVRRGRVEGCAILNGDRNLKITCRSPEGVERPLAPPAGADSPVAPGGGWPGWIAGPTAKAGPRRGPRGAVVPDATVRPGRTGA
ncbi:hypothetical protein JCM13210_23190 [Thermaerobacter litoralis]